MAEEQAGLDDSERRFRWRMFLKVHSAGPHPAEDLTCGARDPQWWQVMCVALELIADGFLVLASDP